eukprot:g2821.t1
MVVNPGKPPTSDTNNANVRVCCRFRPQNELELSKGGKVAHEISCDNAGACRLWVNSRGKSEKSASQWFNFDRTFDVTASQEDVYRYTAKEHVEDALNGFNCTVFAYGQTGAGKSHTMMGPQDGLLENFGIIPRIVRDIFLLIEQQSESDEFTVKVSYVEIYMEKIRDLLDTSKSNLQIRESKTLGVYVEGATELYVSSVEEMLETMLAGDASRAMASTRMNATSSRSHSVFTIVIERRDTKSGVRKTGKMSLVDLAGSELVSKTGASGVTLEEAKKINKSLSALGNVIKALTTRKRHVPYRDSKLTRILQDSLGGNCKTTMVIACSSSSYNEVETLSTLRFGVRAKAIRNRVTARVEYSVEDYKKMLREHKHLLERKTRRIRLLEKTLERAKVKIPTIENDIIEKDKESLNSTMLLKLSPEIDEIDEMEKRAAAAAKAALASRSADNASIVSQNLEKRFQKISMETIGEKDDSIDKDEEESLSQNILLSDEESDGSPISDEDEEKEKMKTSENEDVNTPRKLMLQKNLDEMTSQFLEVKRLLQVQRATMSSTDSDRESLLEENSALLEHLARLQEAVCSHEIRSAKKQQRLFSIKKKMRNREANLNHMQSALEDYQQLYKVTIESHQKRYEALELELARTKSMLTQIHLQQANNNKTNSLTTTEQLYDVVGPALGVQRRCSQFEFSRSPAIAKPIRGGGGGTPALGKDDSINVANTATSSPLASLTAFGYQAVQRRKKTFSDIFSSAIARVSNYRSNATPNRADDNNDEKNKTDNSLERDVKEKERLKNPPPTPPRPLKWQKPVEDKEAETENRDQNGSDIKCKDTGSSLVRDNEEHFADV